jgi:hypothetical protein
MARYNSNLKPPQITTGAQEVNVHAFGFYGPDTHFAQVQARTDPRRLPHSDLKSPVVVGNGIAWHGPGTYLTYPNKPQEIVTRRAPIYGLRPPLVKPALVFGPVRVFFAQAVRRVPEILQTRRTIYGISPPLVKPPVVFPPVSITYWATVKSQQNTGRVRRRGTYSLLPPIIPPLPTAVKRVIPRRTDLLPRRAIYSLFPPIIPVSAQVFFGPDVKLAASKRGAPKSDLHSPAVIGSGLVNPGLRVKLVPLLGRVPDTKSRLSPPTVVTAPTVFTGPKVELAPSRRGAPKSELRPPAVVGAGISFYGPKTRLFPLGIPRQQAKSRLAPPTAVAPAGAFYGPTVVLAPSKRGVPKSHLFSPQVVFTAVELSGPKITLVRIRPPRVLSGLGRAAVTDQTQGPHGGVMQSLAPSFRGRPQSRLFPPAVITSVVQIFYGPQTSLAYSRRGAPKYVLRGPAINPIFTGPALALTYSRRGQAKPRLLPPAVVGAGIYFYPVSVTLAYSLRGRPKSRLAPPAVISTQIFFGPLTKLTYSRRGVPKSRLSPPAVVGGGIYFYPVSTWLTYSNRGKPKSHLFPPTDVIEPIEEGLLRVHLAASFRGKPKSTLRPPIVVFLAVEIYGPKVVLTPSKFGKPKSELRPPAVVGGGIVFRPIDVTLVRIKPPPTRSELKPPTVVQSAATVFYGPQTSLAYSLRGRPIYGLGSPLVAPAVVFAPLSIHFVQRQTRFESRRGTIYGLRSPLVGPGQVFAPISVTLAPSKFGKAKPFFLVARVVNAAFVGAPLSVHLTRIRPVPTRTALRPPEVVNEAVEIYGPATELTYSVRKRGTTDLNPPTVVRLAVEIYGPQIHLTQIKPPPTVALLKPPTDVTEADEILALRVHLAYSLRGKPKSQLRPPTVLFVFIARPTLVFLAPSSRGVPKSLLKPPTVIGAGVAFFGPIVHLTRIKHPPVQYRIFPPTVRVQVCYGVVVGGDSNRFPETMTDSADQVLGGDSAGGNVQGTTTGPSKVQGGDAPGAEQTLDDERREGC